MPPRSSSQLFQSDPYRSDFLSATTTPPPRTRVELAGWRHSARAAAPSFGLRPSHRSPIGRVACSVRDPLRPYPGPLTSPVAPHGTGGEARQLRLERHDQPSRQAPTPSRTTSCASRSIMSSQPTSAHSARGGPPDPPTQTPREPPPLETALSRLL